jgi:hypothetical protein
LQLKRPIPRTAATAGLAGSDDPIIVYSAYEKTRLTDLAADFQISAPR